MSNDPYSPPSAPLRDMRPEAPGSTWKAVALGVLADLLGTFLSSVILFVAIGTVLMSRGASPEQLDAQLQSSDGYMVLGLALGLSCTVLGGYVAARIANQREYYHALLTGIAVLITGEIMLGLSDQTATLAYRVIGDILVIPAALFGGHLRKTGKLRDGLAMPME